MNQRIQELMENADSWHFYDNRGQFVMEEFCEKFAEMIVNECALTIQDFVDHRTPASEYPNRLKRYFGVEE